MTILLPAGYTSNLSGEYMSDSYFKSYYDKAISQYENTDDNEIINIMIPTFAEIIYDNKVLRDAIHFIEDCVDDGAKDKFDTLIGVTPTSKYFNDAENYSDDEDEEEEETSIEKILDDPSKDTNDQAFIRHHMEAMYSTWGGKIGSDFPPLFTGLNLQTLVPVGVVVSAMADDDYVYELDKKTDNDFKFKLKCKPDKKKEFRKLGKLQKFELSFNGKHYNSSFDNSKK